MLGCSHIVLDIFIYNVWLWWQTLVCVRETSPDGQVTGCRWKGNWNCAAPGLTEVIGGWAVILLGKSLAIDMYQNAHVRYIQINPHPVTEEIFHNFFENSLTLNDSKY